MKTVYLDNNCYERLLKNNKAYELLFSLSQNDKGLLSFESSWYTCAGLALGREASGDGDAYIAMLKAVYELIRKDRFFRDFPELVAEEVDAAMGRRKSPHLFYDGEEGECQRRLSQWLMVRDKGLPLYMLLEVKKERAAWVSKMEILRGKQVRESREQGCRPAEQVSPPQAVPYACRSPQAREWMVETLARRFPVLANAWAAVPDMIANHLHAFRTFYRAFAAFHLTRLAADASHIRPHRSLRGQGRHKPDDPSDMRHAAYGRYCDYFVTEDNTLRDVVSMIEETDANGNVFKAWSLAEFLQEAERTATAVE